MPDDVETSADARSATRPWGEWHVLDVGDGYKVKRIEIEAGHRLSYQTHARRSEHWLVVSGTATCVVDGRTVVVGPGEHLDVGEGVPHRIANEGDSRLVILEAQLGDYTEEDDIVRLEDDYARCEE
ncbi:phosphomannose isomerase type II C-terminal cupin domain [Nocardioides sp.]|uniref:phosphomannose isomerase type II C-terminal cupin domain n=1 Tax=Nocardioides sp. TaxID=35761 RepID=UPI002ED36E43